MKMKHKSRNILITSMQRNKTKTCDGCGEADATTKTDYFAFCADCHGEWEKLAVEQLKKEERS